MMTHFEIPPTLYRTPTTHAPPEARTRHTGTPAQGSKRATDVSRPNMCTIHVHVHVHVHFVQAHSNNRARMHLRSTSWSSRLGDLGPVVTRSASRHGAPTIMSLGGVVRLSDSRRAATPSGRAATRLLRTSRSH
eukprot:4316919-Prymnesium_polylepis.2